MAVKNNMSKKHDSDGDLDNLKTELDQLKKTAADLENQLKRAVADYQNLEKRVSEGRSQLSVWATADLMQRLLPIVHNFDQALAGAGQEERSTGWFKGVEMSCKQLMQVLEAEGLTEVETAGHFDPGLHEAVDIRGGEDGKILEVVQKGYKLNGKVLQPAKVVVGRKTG